MSRQIVVHVDGGLVQWVSSVETNDFARLQSVIVVDSDVEGIEDPTTKTWGKDGSRIEAFIHYEPIEDMPDGCDIKLLVEQWIKDNA